MARSGMTAILEELRGMVEAGTADYTMGTTVYWTDNALQDVLDINRIDIVHGPLVPNPIIVGGTVPSPTIRYPYYSFLQYVSPFGGFFENTSGGTSIFYLQDGTGATLGTSLWNADYRRGIVNFVSDTLGTAIYLTASRYDMNAAASNIWRKKASHYAPSSFDFSTDNHSIRRAQVYDHAINMAEIFEGKSGNAMQTVDRFRSDM